MSPDANDDLLREMLREAERDIDHQIRAIEEEDDKTEQSLALAVAVLAGALALASLVAGQGRIDRPFLLATAGGAALNILALLRLLDAYAGLRQTRSVHVGPRLDWLAEKVRDSGWGFADHLSSLIADYANYHAHNAEVHRDLWRERRRALKTLVAAILAYAIAAFYILSKGVFS